MLHHVTLNEAGQDADRPDCTTFKSIAGLAHAVLGSGSTWQWYVGLIWTIHSVLQDVNVRVIVALVYPDQQLPEAPRYNPQPLRVRLNRQFDPLHAMQVQNGALRMSKLYVPLS